MRGRWLNLLFLLLLVLLALAACNLGGPTESELPTASAQDAALTETANPTQPPRPTRTVPPTAGVAQPTALPGVGAVAPGLPTIASSGGAAAAPPALQQANPQAQQGYALQGSGGSIAGNGLTLLNSPLSFFAQNPANTTQYAAVDGLGLLYITGQNGAGVTRLTSGPYTEFMPADRQSNNAVATTAAWSPDGRSLAFIIDGNQTAADGVWYYQPGGVNPLQLLVDCPQEGFTGCNIVIAPDDVRLWESRALDWSPAGDALLVRVNLPAQNRGGLLVLPITLNERARDNRPPVLRFDYGSWGADGRILVSGTNPDGAAFIGWIDRNGAVVESISTPLFGSVALSYAVQRPDGTIVALGASGSGIALYSVSSGQALTAAFASGVPQRVAWSPDRSAVLVESDGRAFVASISGTVSELTAFSAGLPANWVR